MLDRRLRGQRDAGHRAATEQQLVDGALALARGSASFPSGFGRLERHRAPSEPVRLIEVGQQRARGSERSVVWCRSRVRATGGSGKLDDHGMERAGGQRPAREMSEMAKGKRENSESSANTPSPVAASGEWPWWAQFFLALFAMVLGALFLIGLPYVMIAAFDRAENQGAVEAWTAMVPTLLGLTTMTISGIFVFMTFRIDRGARAEARTMAEKIAKKRVQEVFEERAESEVKKWRKELFKDVTDAKNQAEDITKKLDLRAAEYDASNERMAIRFSSIDESIRERFAAADERIGERFAAADERIGERFATADERIGERVADAESRIEWRFERLARNADEHIKRVADAENRVERLARNADEQSSALLAAARDRKTEEHG